MLHHRALQKALQLGRIGFANTVEISLDGIYLAGFFGKIHQGFRISVRYA